MVSVKDSIRQSLRNFIRLHFEKRFILLWKNFSLTWINGWSTTTEKEPIKEKCAAAELLGRLYRMLWRF